LSPVRRWFSISDSWILPPFFIAVILAYILVPLVDALSARFRVRRIFVVTALYILLVAVLALLFMWLGPVVMTEVRAFRRDSVSVVQRAIVELAGGEQFTLLGNVVDSGLLAREIINRVRQNFDSPTTALQFAQGFFQRAAEWCSPLLRFFTSYSIGSP